MFHRYFRKCTFNLKSNFNIAVANRLESSHSSNNVTNPEHLSWSTGEKEKPWSKKFVPDDFGKTPWTKKRNMRDFLGLQSHQIDINDPTQKFPYKRADGGIQYLNFVYYPRFPDQIEPSINPSALFMIKRRKRLSCRPWWEKVIMKKLGLHKSIRKHEDKSKVVIVKNIPEINGLLWMVKHLITITPLKLPENIPENANPLDFVLTDDGEIKYRSGKAPYKEDELTFEVLPEKQIFDRKWVDDKMRKIYLNSIDSDF